MYYGRESVLFLGQFCHKSGFCVRNTFTYKFTDFARLYLPYCTTFHNQTFVNLTNSKMFFRAVVKDFNRLDSSRLNLVHNANNQLVPCGFVSCFNEQQESSFTCQIHIPKITIQFNTVPVQLTVCQLTLFRLFLA